MAAWSHIPLGEIAPAKGNPAPPLENVVWNLSLEDIEPQTGKILARKLWAVSALGSTKCSFDSRHVLYSKLRPYLNKVVVPETDGVGTSELIPLRPDADRIDRDFLAYYLRSPDFLSFAIANTRGANLPRISMEDLWGHKIPVAPTLPEQRRIVARIKECMERVEEIEKLREEADREQDSVFPSLLSKTFDGLRDCPQQEIGNLAIETRYGTSHKCNTATHGTPILRIPNVINGSVNFENLKYCQLEAKELECLRLKKGDLLFVRTNGSRELVGRCAIFYSQPEVNSGFGFASYLIRVRLDQARIRPEFVAYFLNSTHGRSELNKRRRTSAGQFNINSENLRNIKVPVPSIDIQDSLIEAFATQAEEISKLKDESSDASKESSHLRDAILRRAFAGEL